MLYDGLSDIFGSFEKVRKRSWDGYDFYNEKKYKVINDGSITLIQFTIPGVEKEEVNIKVKDNKLIVTIKDEKTDFGLISLVDKDNIEKCKKVGMNDYLQKPFHKKQLIALLEKWVASESV